MRIKLSDLVNHDGVQRYRHTFLHFFYKGEDVGICYLHTIGETTVLFNADGVQTSLRLTELPLWEIEPIMPHSMWKQHGKHSVSFLRRPARQWRRSMSEGTHVFRYDLDLIKAKNAEMRDRISSHKFPSLHYSSLPAINAIFKTPKISFTEAISMLKDTDTFSVAVDDTYCLGWNGALYLEDEKIAKFFFRQQTYTTHSLFSEELRDLTRNSAFREISK